MCNRVFYTTTLTFQVSFPDNFSPSIETIIRLVIYLFHFGSSVLECFWCIVFNLTYILSLTWLWT